MPDRAIRRHLITLFTDLVYCTLTEVFLNLTEVFLTLTEVFLCFFLSCKANARVKLAKTRHGPHSSTLVVICVVRLLFVFSMYCLWAWGSVVATSRRVLGSIPGHWGFFPGHQTVACALGSTQPLKISTRIFLGVKT